MWKSFRCEAPHCARERSIWEIYEPLGDVFFCFSPCALFHVSKLRNGAPSCFRYAPIVSLTSKHRDFKHLVFIQRFRSTFCVLLGRKVALMQAANF